VGELISLAAWREKKEDELYDKLSAEMQRVIDDLEDMTRYMPSSVSSDEPFLTEGGYIRVDKNAQSCVSALALVSRVLFGLGKLDASNTIENVIVRLENDACTIPIDDV